MGITLANMKGIDIDDILDFKESLSVLLISSLFIILAARIEFRQLTNIGWPAIDPKNKLHIFTADKDLVPESDWHVISLIQPEGEDQS